MNDSDTVFSEETVEQTVERTVEQEEIIFDDQTIRKPLDECNKVELLAVFNAAAELLNPAEDDMRAMADAKATALLCRELSLPSRIVRFLTVLAVVFVVLPLLIYESYTGNYGTIAEALGISLIGLIAAVLTSMLLVTICQIPRIIKRRQCTAKHNQLRKKIKNYVKDTLQGSEAERIPPDYRYGQALKSMTTYLRNMEAATWPECVTIWKTDLYRSMMGDGSAIDKAAVDEILAVWRVFWKCE